MDKNGISRGNMQNAQNQKNGREQNSQPVNSHISNSVSSRKSNDDPNFSSRNVNFRNQNSLIERSQIENEPAQNRNGEISSQNQQMMAQSVQQQQIQQMAQYNNQNMRNQNVNNIQLQNPIIPFDQSAQMQGVYIPPQYQNSSPNINSLNVMNNLQQIQNGQNNLLLFQQQQQQNLLRQQQILRSLNPQMNQNLQQILLQQNPSNMNFSHQILLNNNNQNLNQQIQQANFLQQQSLQASQLNPSFPMQPGLFLNQVLLGSNQLNGFQNQIGLNNINQNFQIQNQINEEQIRQQYQYLPQSMQPIQNQISSNLNIQQAQNQPAQIQEQQIDSSQHQNGEEGVDNRNFNFRILHVSNFKIHEVLTQSSQAIIFFGTLENYNGIFDKDIKYVYNKYVVLKQFLLKKERMGFKKELKILKKIKSLQLEDNGGFPVIISAKLSNTIGEILMSYAGQDIFTKYNIQKSLEDRRAHKGLTLQQLSDFGMQMVSQMEIIHKLGYTHGDLKFQNICFHDQTKKYTILDFALVTKIFHKNGIHKQQEKVRSFYGNSLFASDSMINLKTTSRKDDLESLMYIMCFLHSGTLPIIEFINKNIQEFQMSRFLNEVLKFRQENLKYCHERIKSLLPSSMASAFQYIVQLQHEQKPDYQLIKLLMTFNPDDEFKVFASKLTIQNKRLARDILYENSNSPRISKTVNQSNQLEEIKSFKRSQSVQDVDLNPQQQLNIIKLNKKLLKEEKKEDNKGDSSCDFEDCEEVKDNDQPIELAYQKREQQKKRKQYIREFILNHQDKSAMRKSSQYQRIMASGVSSINNNDGFVQDVKSDAGGALMASKQSGSVLSAKGSIKDDGENQSQNSSQSHKNKVGYGFPQNLSSPFQDLIKKKSKLINKANKIVQQNQNVNNDDQLEQQIPQLEKKKEQENIQQHQQQIIPKIQPKAQEQAQKNQVNQPHSFLNSQNPYLMANQHQQNKMNSQNQANINIINVQSNMQQKQEAVRAPIAGQNGLIQDNQQLNANIQQQIMLQNYQQMMREQIQNQNQVNNQQQIKIDPSAILLLAQQQQQAMINQNQFLQPFHQQIPQLQNQAINGIINQQQQQFPYLPNILLQQPNIAQGQNLQNIQNNAQQKPAAVPKINAYNPRFNNSNNNNQQKK